MNGLGAPAAAGAALAAGLCADGLGLRHIVAGCAVRLLRVWFRCCWCCSCCAVARVIDSEFLTAAGILEKLAKIQKLIVFFLMYFV